MKITFDPNVDAAYIQLVDEIGLGGVAKTYPCDPREVGGMINLDFDSDGRLLGIEVLDATKKLSLSHLESGDRSRSAISDHVDGKTMLTAEEAFAAMFEFLKVFLSELTDANVADVLSEINPAYGGKSSDPGAWHAWLASVEKVMRS